tara:strand:- start:2623 stop:4716 length:2094 start_codon:yes stop_codon:yes gene_type:complete
MQNSKDLEYVLKRSSERAKVLKRPYVCLDILFNELVNSRCASVESIFRALGLDVLEVALVSVLYCAEKKPSKNPSGRLHRDCKELLDLMEEYRVELDQEDNTPELLLLAFLSSYKKSHVIKFFDEAGFNFERAKIQIRSFITDCPFVKTNFFDHKATLDVEVDEEEVAEEKNILDPLKPNPILDKVATNLNQKAFVGEFDSLIPFEEKINEVIVTLCRQKKPNAILVGIAGGGKTSIVESLAKQIMDKEVPEILENMVIFELQLSTIVAGTKYRGEFEAKLEAFLKEVTKYENVIIFIDEIHTLVGAGGTGTQNDLDASNILKPMLARGDIKCIGATTHYEYEQKIKTDPALDRRFEKVVVVPPTRSRVEKILPDLISFYTKFHNVKYTEIFVNKVLDYCDKFLPNRVYPDKLIDALDHCAASAKINGSKSVSQLQLNTFFGKKRGIIANTPTISGLIKDLNKELVGHTKQFKHFKDSLCSLSARPSEFKNAHPPFFLFYGSGQTGKTSLINIIEQYAKSQDVATFRTNGRNLTESQWVTGFHEKAYSISQNVALLNVSLVLIDDFDKASTKAQEAVLQIARENEITMTNGDTVDFSNTIFILTTGQKSQPKKLGFSEGKENEAMPILDDALKNFCFEQINLKTISKRDLKILLTKRLKISTFINDFDKVDQIISDNFGKKDFIRVSKKELEKIIFK